MTNFESTIIEGLKSTIEDYILLKGQDFENQWSKPEYLATVNIAKSLTKFNSYPAEKIIIAIEENTHEFSQKCVPQDLQNLFETKLNSFNTERNGKIDIAIYKSFQIKPLCTIEVKNFNPTDGVLILDLERNAEYFKFATENNISVIKKTIVAYFRHFQETKFSNQIQFDIDNAKKELQELINTNVDTAGISVRTEAVTIYNNLLYNGKYSTEEIYNDTGEFYGQSVHFIGVLGIFEKQSPPSRLKIEKHSKEETAQLSQWYESINNEQKLSLEFRFNEDTFYSIKLDNEIIGIMSVLEGGNKYSDLRRFVLETHRKKGYAEDMLNYLIREGRKSNIKRINGTLKSLNIKGIEFLQNKGFKVTKFGKIDEEEYTSVNMKLK